MGKIVRLAALAALSSLVLNAQTTQGLISGTILNSVTGRPLTTASITCLSTTLAATGSSKTDQTGSFFLPMLSPGTYTIRATSDGYQAQELQQLELSGRRTHPDRFPAPPPQRRLGSRPVPQRLPARHQDHRHLLRARRRHQPLGHVRRPAGQARHPRHLASPTSSTRPRSKTCRCRAATFTRCWSASPA